LVKIKEKEFHNAIMQLKQFSNVTDIGIGFDYNMHEYTYLVAPRGLMAVGNPIVFKIGEKVKVTEKYNPYFGRTGKIVNIMKDRIWRGVNLYTVKFDNKILAQYYGYALSRTTKIQGKNPLLMAVHNPPVARCPFKEDKKTPIKDFQNWLYAEGNPTDIKRFREAIARYKKFHLGAEPESVSRQVINIGSKDITDRDFVFSAGKSPADLYEVPAHSGKENNRRGYIHHWGNRPETLITRDGKAIVKQLKGKARVTDWFRG
jgi:hypothetical protein